MGSVNPSNPLAGGAAECSPSLFGNVDCQRVADGAEFWGES
jgi:hypothetical protein